jgi:hypothetical protein
MPERAGDFGGEGAEGEFRWDCRPGGGEEGESGQGFAASKRHEGNTTKAQRNTKKKEEREKKVSR